MTLLGREDETCCRSLANADAEEVNLQAGLLLCDIGADFQHVALKDGCVVTIEVKRVVLKEGSTAFKALTHEPCCTIEASALPVTLSTEAVAVVHQTLRSETWNLIEAMTGLLNINITEVIEVRCEALGTISLQHGTDRKLSLGCIPDLFVFNRRLIFQIVGYLIFLEVDIVHEGIDISILDLVEIFEDG